MEKDNSKKGLIVLVIILSLLVVGLSSYLIYDKVLSDKQDTNINEDNNSIEEDNSSNVNNNNSNENEIKEYTLNLNSEECVYPSSSEYALVEPYSFTINTKINNEDYSFKYISDLKNRLKEYWLNDYRFNIHNYNEAVLSKVCQYGNYIVYSTGWEGPGYTTILNSQGIIVDQFKEGRNTSYSNGILFVEKINNYYNIENKQDGNGILEKYELDLRVDSFPLVKKNYRTEEYICEALGYC